MSCACALINNSALRARLPYAVPGCSRFLGRSEHTCGTRALQEDCSGILTHNISTLACLEVQALPLSYLLLLLLLYPDITSHIPAALVLAISCLHISYLSSWEHEYVLLKLFLLVPNLFVRELD